jgi:hypothetical protein
LLSIREYQTVLALVLPWVDRNLFKKRTHGLTCLSACVISKEWSYKNCTEDTSHKKCSSSAAQHAHALLYTQRMYSILNACRHIFPWEKCVLSLELWIFIFSHLWIDNPIMSLLRRFTDMVIVGCCYFH